MFHWTHSFPWRSSCSPLNTAILIAVNTWPRTHCSISQDTDLACVHFEQLRTFKIKWISQQFLQTAPVLTYRSLPLHLDPGHVTGTQKQQVFKALAITNMFPCALFIRVLRWFSSATETTELLWVFFFMLKNKAEPSHIKRQWGTESHYWLLEVQGNSWMWVRNQPGKEEICPR